MENFRLKVFGSVARNLSFTKASHELFITQPAITKHIQALETHYGVRLFNRRGNKITLTAAGKILYEYANRLIKLEKEIEEQIGQFKENETGILRLGASTTIAQYVIPPILSGFHKVYPGVKMSLLNGNSEQIADALKNDLIDLGIVEGKLKDKDIHYELFMYDELVAVCSSGNRIVKENEITLKELADQPLVLRERGSGTLEVLEYALKGKKIRLSSLNIIMYLGSTEAIKRYLESGTGIGFISVKAVEKELKDKSLRIIKVKRFKVRRSFDFISLHGNTPAGQLAKFIRFAKHYYN